MVIFDSLAHFIFRQNQQKIFFSFEKEPFSMKLAMFMMKTRDFYRKLRFY